MSEDGKFWTAIWCIITVASVALSVVYATYSIDHNTKILEMVSKGVSPMAAMCGLQDVRGNNPVCVLLASKE